MKQKAASRIACNSCHQRKVACDGARPTCSTCRKRDADCFYDTARPSESRAEALRRTNRELRARLTMYERYMPGVQVLASPNKSRYLTLSGPLPISDPDTTLQSLIISPLRVAALSEHQARRALLPPTCSRVEYQLMISFSTLYPCFANATGELFEEQPLLTSVASDPQVLESTRYAEALSPSLPRVSSVHQATKSSNHFCDERLQDLDISFWSTANVTNKRAAHAISFFLHNDQPIAGLLEADLFVRDLVSKQSRFCSPFLVSSLLWWISHGYKTLDPKVKPELFAAEALARASTAISQHDSCTVAGCLALSLAASAAGMLEVANQFMDLVQSISISLGWFDPPSDLIDDLGTDAADQLKADAHVSWAVFNYITLSSFYTQQRMMRSPPRFHIPGDAGAIGLDSDTRAPVFHSLPAYMDEIFTATCHFFLIANEITLAHLSDDEDVARSRLSLTFAEPIFHKLLEWSERPCLQLFGNESDTQHKIVLHTWFHSRVIDLFRPFQGSPVRLQSFAYRECTTQDIYTASLNQLKRHTYLYPLRYEHANLSGWFGMALIQLTSSVIADRSEPNCRFWLWQCVRNLYQLSITYPLLKLVLEIYTKLAMSKNILSTDEANTILHAGDQSVGNVVLRGDYVLDLHAALDNRRNARMDRLLSAFETANNESDP